MNGLVINVGTGVETSVRELVRTILALTSRDVEVIYNDRTAPGVSRMCADIALARQKLNYQPRIRLEDGLRLTLERDPRLKLPARRTP